MNDVTKGYDIDEWLTQELDKNAGEEGPQDSGAQAGQGVTTPEKEGAAGRRATGESSDYDDHLGVMRTFDDELMDSFSGDSGKDRTRVAGSTVLSGVAETAGAAGSAGREDLAYNTQLYKAQRKKMPGKPGRAGKPFDLIGSKAAEAAARSSMTRMGTLTTTALQAGENKPVTRAGGMDEEMEEIRRRREQADKMVTQMLERQRSAPILDEEPESRTEKMIGHAVDAVEEASQKTLEKSKGKLSEFFSKLKKKFTEHEPKKEEAEEIAQLPGSGQAAGKSGEEAGGNTGEQAARSDGGQTADGNAAETESAQRAEAAPEQAAQAVAPGDVRAEDMGMVPRHASSKVSERPAHAAGEPRHGAHEAAVAAGTPVATVLTDSPAAAGAEPEDFYIGKHGSRSAAPAGTTKPADEDSPLSRMDPKKRQETLYELQGEAEALARSIAEAEARLKKKEEESARAQAPEKPAREKPAPENQAQKPARSDVTMQLDAVFGDGSSDARKMAEKMRQAVSDAATESEEAIKKTKKESKLPEASASAMEFAAAAEREIADKNRRENYMNVKATRFGQDHRTVRNALKYGRQELMFVENGRHDATEIFRYVFGFSDKDIILRRDEVLDDQAIREYEKMIERRLHGEPLQYIIGVQEFMGLPFRVNEHVLIPRQDTEVLVEQVLGVIKGRELEKPEILDMCAGSGAIGVSLAFERPDAQVTMADISTEAISVAMDNAQLNGVFQRCTFVTGDLFDALPGWKKFDVIVCNPPYIKSDVIETLQPEVRDHEPRRALDGGKDGLTIYRRIAKEAGAHLVSHGVLALEIGYDQAVDVVTILGQGGDFDGARIIKDLDNKDRVIIALKNK